MKVPRGRIIPVIGIIEQTGQKGSTIADTERTVIYIFMKPPFMKLLLFLCQIITLIENHSARSHVE